MKGSRATGGGVMGARPHPSLIKGGKPPPLKKACPPKSLTGSMYIVPKKAIFFDPKNIILPT